jgi:AcrR family transcriptional regulator
MQSTLGVTTRDRIIEMAEVLLRRHGEDKLTIVDIARALGMSHANVYRFFANKSAILDAVINRWLVQGEAFLEEIALRPQAASERLEAVVLELHRKRRQKFLDDAEVFESLRRVFVLRPHAVAHRREALLSVFRRLIQEGIDGGEFREMDVNVAARTMKDAAVLFLDPMMIPTLGDADMEERASHLVHHILAAFSVDPSRFLDLTLPPVASHHNGQPELVPSPAEN